MAKNLRRFCENCQDWVQAEPDHTDGRPNDTYSCTVCGEQILCGECGQEWSESHRCGSND